MAGDRLYLAEAHSLPDSVFFGNCPSLIIIGNPPAKYYSGRCNLVVIPNMYTITEMINRLLEIFIKYNSWEAAMVDAVICNAPVRTFGELSEPIFENPIRLFNTNLNCVFSIINTERYSLPEDYVVSIYESRDVAALEESTVLKFSPKFKEMTSSKTPVILESDLYSYRAMSQSIVFDDKNVGHIIVDEIHRKFSDRDYPLLALLASTIVSSIQNNYLPPLGRPRQMDDVLHKLLDRKYIAEELVVSMLNELGWKANHKFFCITIEPTEYDRMGQTMNLLVSRLSVVTSCNCYTIYNGMIVFVFNLTIAKVGRYDFVQRLLPILRDSMLKAGIST